MTAAQSGFESPSDLHFVMVRLDARLSVDVLARQLAETHERYSDRTLRIIIDVGACGDEIEELGREEEVKQQISAWKMERRARLADFGKLPGAWQKLLLASIGGSGEETYEQLFLSLSDAPAMPAGARRLVHAIDRAEGYRRRHKGRLPWAQDIIDDDRGWNALDAYHDAEAAWERSLRFQRIALDLLPPLAGLSHVPAMDIGMLAVSDDALFDEAEKIAFLRRGQARRAANGFAPRWHPRELDPSSIRRDLRRRVGRAAIWVGGILRVIGGRPSEGRPRYADDWTVGRWRDKNAKTKCPSEKKLNRMSRM